MPTQPPTTEPSEPPTAAMEFERPPLGAPAEGEGDFSVPPARRRRVLGLGWGWWAVLGAAVALVSILAAVSYRSIAKVVGRNDLSAAEVIRGDMKVIVSADGTVRSDKTVDVKSEIEGSATILDIVPESTRIAKAGEFLVRLDTSGLEDRRATQEIKVKQTKAAVDLAEKELDIQRNQNASTITTAELARKFAEIDLEKYVKGDWPQQLQEAQNAITIATEEYKRAQDRLGWSQKLAEKGYISGSELTADELAVKRNELDVELAKMKLQVLETYTHPKDLAQRQSDLDGATAELERTRAKAAAVEAKAVTELDSKREAYELEKDQLDKINRQLAAGTIRSPQPGLVVYASTGRRQRRFQQDEIAVGYSVREGETVITLPDLNVMVADVNVPEAKREAVNPGQPAIVTVESQPNVFLSGRVQSRGLMPVAQNWWSGGDVQQFQVVVAIDKPPEWLVPGLRCTADVLVEELDDALQVPVQAIFQRGETHFCYVLGGDGSIRAVPVWIGVDDDKMVQVIGGLAEGEKVLLAEPENAAGIPLEAPTFEKPTPQVRPRMTANHAPPATQPAGAAADPPTTAPDAQLSAEDAAVIERIRRFDAAKADALTRMSPEQRRSELERMRQQRRQRPRSEGGGRGGND